MTDTFVLTDKPVNNFTSEHSNPTIERSAATGNDVITCRICYDDDHQENLITPCRCRGTIGLVHLACLQQWLLITQRTRCELCNYEFPTCRMRRYSLLGSLPAWFASVVDGTQMCFDLMGLFIITPIVALGIYAAWTALIWYSQTLKDLENNNIHNNNEDFDDHTGTRKAITESAYLTYLGLLSTTTTLVMGYVAWITCVIHFYFVSWYNWYTLQTDIILMSTHVIEESNNNTAEDDVQI